MLNRRTFGILPDGTAVDAIALGGDGGLKVNVLTYGCIITSLRSRD
jgi:galactose mutarotase-like enzyme